MIDRLEHNIHLEHVLPLRLLIAELEIKGCGGFQSGRAGRAVSVLSSIKRYEFAAEHLSIQTLFDKNILLN